MRSVRARTALFATAVVALALVAAGAGIVLALRANLTSQAGLQAQLTAREVATDIATGTAYDRLELPDAEDHPVQVVDEGGRLLAASEDLEAVTGTGTAAVKPAPTASPSPSPSPSGDDDDDDDDADDDLRPGSVSDSVDYATGSVTADGETAEYRFAAVTAGAPDGRTVTVHAGAPLSAERDAVSSVTGSMLTGLGPLLLVVAAVTWLVTRRALRPVEAIRTEMAAITASTDLTRRVPEPRSGDEVAALAVTTNETLGALESSVDRQRRFVADASHELRSPIASLRAQLEVAAAHPELLDIDGAVEDVVRLQNLAADLLLLARLDAGERPAQDRKVALDALVGAETAARHADRLPVEVRIDDPVPPVRGSRTQLARVLANLLDNAQRHAAGQVRVALRAEGGDVVLEVADDGPGVPPGERERIFDRFVRLDDARARDDGGAGLGLAIVRDVVTRHGGTVHVADEGPGACFAVRLPAAP